MIASTNTIQENVACVSSVAGVGLQDRAHQPGQSNKCEYDQSEHK